MSKKGKTSHPPLTFLWLQHSPLLSPSAALPRLHWRSSFVRAHYMKMHVVFLHKEETRAAIFSLLTVPSPLFSSSPFPPSPRLSPAHTITKYQALPSPIMLGEYASQLRLPPCPSSPRPGMRTRSQLLLVPYFFNYTYTRRYSSQREESCCQGVVCQWKDGGGGAASICSGG